METVELVDQLNTRLPGWETSLNHLRLGKGRYITFEWTIPLSVLLKLAIERKCRTRGIWYNSRSKVTLNRDKWGGNPTDNNEKQPTQINDYKNLCLRELHEYNEAQMGRALRLIGRTTQLQTIYLLRREACS